MKRRRRIDRILIDKIHRGWMFIAMVVVIMLPLFMLIGLVFKSYLLSAEYPLFRLLFSAAWNPLLGQFGFYPFLISSIWVSILALLIATPICLFSAIHLTQYAPRYILRIMHPVVDILAGIPSVIYGVWGILVIVPFISDHLGPFFGKAISGYSILAGSIVLSIMIIPFILNIMVDVLKTVPAELSEASLSLGATRWQTIKFILVRKAFPGLISSVALGLSRAFGETIAVLMVVGNVVRVPSGAFQPGYHLPALIANNYGEMLSIPMYDSALMFAALLLFVIVLLFNMISRLLIIYTEKICQ